MEQAYPGGKFEALYLQFAKDGCAPLFCFFFFVGFNSCRSTGVSEKVQTETGI